jgi:hypothetical protein
VFCDEGLGCSINEVARQFFAALLGEAKKLRLHSSEHFPIECTLLQSLASIKSS